MCRIGPMLILPLDLCGCHGAPACNVFGSYFPTWMFCALAGVALALVAHRLLMVHGFNKYVPAPLVVYLAFAIAAAFGLWLIWLQ